MIRILIVDDSVFSQRLTGNLLKKYLGEVDITYAKDGEEGFEKFREETPDYIFVDLLMPKLDGFELIKLMQEHSRDAKIIVLTADIQTGVREEITNLGVMAFENKPFNEEKAEAVCNRIKGDYDGTKSTTV